MTKIMAVQSHAVAQLPKSTIRLLASSQVITSVSSVVKELMENALDAGAASIDIRLEKHGLEKIEVKDDGCGIREADCTCMALPHYTSKLKSFTDLEELVSYGFRGEALHSVCSVASVSITTRTNDDTTARRYKLDKCGQAVEFETVHGLKGTTVTVTDLFKNLPVRRQVMSCTKRMNEELRKVENIVKSLSVINPAVRVSLAHNKCLIWQKTAVQHLRLSVMQVFSYNITKHLHHIIHHTNKVDIEMLIPKHDCDIKSLCSGAGTESYHLFVSKRPIKDKEIEKVISEVLSGFFGNDLPPNKSILCIIAITLPPDRLDINLEPNKTKIFIKDKEEILNCLTDLLNSYYSRADSAINTENKIVDEPKAKKKRMESTRENSEIEETTLVDSTSEILDKSSVLDKELPFSSSITKPNNFTPLQPINQETNFVQQNNISVENKNVHSNIYPVEAVNKNLKQRINIESILLQESELELVPRGCSPSLPNELVESVIGSPNSRSTHSDLGGLEATEPEPNNSVVDDSMLKNSRTLDSKLVGHIFYPQKIDDSITKLGNDSRVNEIQLGKSENFSRSALTDNCLDKEKAPTVQLPVESVEHNYLDNPSLSQWSKGGLISSSGDKILGSCVLKKSTVESEEKYRLESSNFLGVNPNSQMKTIENSIPDERNVLENGANPGQESIPLGNKLFSCESRRKPSDNDGVIAETVYKQSKTEFASSSFSDDKSLELERSVSSQMGNKQMSGFTTFARQMRSQILKESPGISFTAVAGILASKWRSLQESEKDRYNIIASSNKNKKNLKTVDKDVKKENLKSPSCESPNNERNYIVSNATMESLSISLDIPVENSNSSVVGRLGSSDLWICTRVCGKPTTEIGLINSQLLDEAYRFKQNMNIMELPLEPLERSITISPRFLSEKLWKVLVSLESVIDRSGEGSVITDKRIVMNGFRIRIVSNGENTCAHLMDLALHITDHYGVDDLQMTLELIEKHGVESCTVTQSRCPNAIKYIQSETFRQTAQMLNHDILNDAHELENRLRIIESDKSTCWKSFYKALHVSP